MQKTEALVTYSKAAEKAADCHISWRHCISSSPNLTFSFCSQVHQPYAHHTKSSPAAACLLCMHPNE